MSQELLNYFDIESCAIFHGYAFVIPYPMEYLPPYFDEWNVLASKMMELVKTKEFRAKVDQMSQLDHEKLNGFREKHLAHLQLSIIGAGYVWQNGDHGVPHTIPKCLAIPWYRLSENLGMKPVLSHADLILSNWKKKDANKPLELDNLTCLYNVADGEGPVWFVTVTVQIEIEFYEALINVIHGVQAVADNDVERLISCLYKIEEAERKMVEVLKRTHEKLPPDCFYYRMRPFLAGWGTEGSAIPNGLIYEGISDEPMKMIGGSAGQSSTIQTLDVGLGVEHSNDKQDFLETMRNYMPKPHKEFIEELKRSPSIRNFVKEKNVPRLTKVYNKCLKNLQQFRSFHIQVVCKYVVNKAKEEKTTDYSSLEKRGTGGSDLIPFLKEIRQTTTMAEIES